MNAQDAWTPVIGGGFDNTNNRAVTAMEVFNGKIFAGAGHDSAAVYSSATGNPGTWQKVFTDFGYVNVEAMTTTAEGTGRIYLSEYSYSSPVQKVLKSVDGTTWVPYFNSINNRVKNIIPFNGTGTADSIYIVVEATYGDMILKSSYDSNDPDNIEGLWDTVLNFDQIFSYERINCISKCNNKLFFGTNQGRLYSSADGNTWAQNAGAGIGFSNPNNYELSAIGSLGTYIYVGTKNYTDGGQIWRTNDEVVWDSVMQFPSGQEKVTSFNTIASNLWVTTYTFGPNGENIYKTTDGTNYTNSNNNGFGYDNNGSYAKIVLFGNNIYSSSENYFPGLAPIAGINTQNNGGQIWRLCSFVPTPVLVTPSTSTYCGNLISPPLFTATAGFSSYMWEGTAPSALNQHGFPTAGSHYVCAIDANGCSSFDTVTVNLLATPTSVVTTPSPIAPTFACPGIPINISTSNNSSIRNMLPTLSSTASAAITDGGTTIDSIVVSGVNDDGLNNTLVGVTIDSLYHMDDGDLLITLIAPNGSYMNLSYYSGTGTQNYIGTVFTPTASTWIASGIGGPFTGTYSPYDPFYYLSGPTNGTWKIQIYDNLNLNTGFLKGWSLNFSEPDTNMTYSWTPATGLSSTTTASTVSTALATTSYALTVTNTIGCTVTDTIKISVPHVQITTADSSSVCYASSLALSATGGSSYLWSPNISLSDTVGATVLTNTAVNMMYYVTDTTTGCTSIDSIHVLANPFFSVSPGPDQTVCHGDTAHVSASGSGGTPGYTYVWNYDSFTYPGQNAGLVGLTTGSATLTATDAAGCYASNYMSIMVIPSTDIYGHVNYYGGSLTTGTNTAVIYKFLPYFTQFDTAQVQPVNASGDYHFTSIDHGDYLIKIFADTLVHPDLDPTYFGDQWAWDAADTIMHNCGLSDTANVTMIHEIGLGGGPGFATGQITEGLGYGHAPSDPIPGVDVHLGRNPGGAAMITTTTDALGNYSFSNIPYNTVLGEHYTVYVDIPGLGRDSSYSFVVDSTHLNYYYLDYYVDSTTIYIVPNAGVGVSNISMATLNKFNVYPNPFKENTTIEYTTMADVAVKLEVYNVLGTKINTIINCRQQAGEHKYNLNNLNSGVYFITLTIDKEVSTQRVIVIE